MLVFATGFSPVYGKQVLYFFDKTFSMRSRIDAPERSDVIDKNFRLCGCGNVKLSDSKYISSMWIQ